VDIEGIKDKVGNEQRKNTFIERTLTKAFNLMGPKGYCIEEVCRFIKQHSEHRLKLEKTGIKSQEGEREEDKEEWLFSERDWEYADLLLRNYQLAEDKDAFRVHTKGKGAICVDPQGIEQGTFIVEYFGEIYEPWRWFDREDFIKEVLKKRKVKKHMPEFYNIALEKHPDEPLGSDMLMVDPSRKGNFSSRFSHSCDPNCGTIITVSEGKYYIGMYAFRDIVYGEELTFDYCSMTESNFEHINSICLCGMKRCRGFYLQLSNTKMFNNLMDNKNCFFTRNSAILKARAPPSPEQLAVCEKYNLRPEGFLKGAPDWIASWIASVLTFIEEEGEIYQNSLMASWSKDYPWQNASSEEEKQENIRRYSLTSRQELESIRLQNLMTSVDKINYFYEKNQHTKPPIFLETPEKIFAVLVGDKESVLKELQDNLIHFKQLLLPKIIEEFLGRIERVPLDLPLQLSLFRLCCLLVSHRLLQLNKPNFSYDLLSDITYFYAFTHTYFSPTELTSFEAEEINISMSEIMGEKAPHNERREKSCKKYASPFVWGQMASWYKQTIVCPEASLSQDRRGTLSYPLIRSVMYLY
jgi:[histone H3]-lysine4 N-trimethyltransferase ATXR3